MGLFKKRSDPAELERLKADIESMSARLAASDAAKQQLDQQVAGIVTRLDTPIAPPPTERPPPPAPPTPTIDPKQLDMLAAKLERLNERVEHAANDSASSEADAQRVDPAEVAEIRTALEQLTSRLAEVDARITSISVELANQISELSGDLESLGGNEPPTDEIVDELRDAQTRLASEQARYQIAFRQDLADLADRLKRS